MNLYPLYLKELDDLEIVETEYGFVIYKFRPNDCYIQDIYVLPEYRQKGVASTLADLVAAKAKSSGYSVLTGSVDSRYRKASISDKVLTSYGMSPYSTEGHMTYYMKEIS